MKKYKVLLTPKVVDFLDNLGAKSRRICRDNLKKLKYPYPGRGPGDKEKLPVRGEKRYRLHIGRTYTAFYEVLEEKGQVRVTEIVTIDEAHDRYGF
ncbi:type II toxin-antitoxin system RelE/ParE family toxin [Candidatus Bipolaricaulota bacterium]|nr:type II toxin-antitoxin system RelE/ParE family toxin [Candidatus Bipolaricaulota bacterium]